MSSRNNPDFPQPWLAGVCAWIAWQMDWNVSGVRIAALLLLFCMPVATVVTYLLGALCLGWQCGGGRTEPAAPPTPLGRRIDSMEERMRAFDAELERRRKR